MLDLVGNPEDQFSRVAAHIFSEKCSLSENKNQQIFKTINKLTDAVVPQLILPRMS